MIAYKLFRQRKDGSIGSLFFNPKAKLKIGVWIPCKKYHKKGFAFRPFWHAFPVPHAVHLTEKNRVWYKVQLKNYKHFHRPKSHGGLWYLAKNIKVLEAV